MSDNKQENTYSVPQEQNMIIELLIKFRESQKNKPTREKAIILTKLEECLLWYTNDIDIQIEMFCKEYNVSKNY
jgi:hypothetical protein